MQVLWPADVWKRVFCFSFIVITQSAFARLNLTSEPLERQACRLDVSRWTLDSYPVTADILARCEQRRPATFIFVKAYVGLLGSHESVTYRFRVPLIVLSGARFNIMAEANQDSQDLMLIDLEFDEAHQVFRGRFAVQYGKDTYGAIELFVADGHAGSRADRIIKQLVRSRELTLAIASLEKTKRIT